MPKDPNKPTTRVARAEKAEATADKRDARIALLRQYAKDGRTWDAVAAAEGVTRHALYKFASLNCEDVIPMFRTNRLDAGHGMMKGKEEIVFILKMLVGAEEGKWPYSLIATRCRVTRAAVSQWKKKFAPFGACDALEDYLEDEEDLEHFHNLMSEIEPVEVYQHNVNRRGPGRKNREKPALRRAGIVKPTDRWTSDESVPDVGPETNLNLTLGPETNLNLTLA